MHVFWETLIWKAVMISYALITECIPGVNSKKPNIFLIFAVLLPKYLLDSIMDFLTQAF